MKEKVRKKNFQLINTNREVTAREKKEIYRPNRQSAEATIHETGIRLSREYLINKLNYTNFQDDTILINFKHKKITCLFLFTPGPNPAWEINWIAFGQTSLKLARH